MRNRGFVERCSVLGLRKIDVESRSHRPYRVILCTHKSTDVGLYSRICAKKVILQGKDAQAIIGFIGCMCFSNPEFCITFGFGNSAQNSYQNTFAGWNILSLLPRGSDKIMLVGQWGRDVHPFSGHKKQHTEEYSISGSQCPLGPIDYLHLFVWNGGSPKSSQIIPNPLVVFTIFHIGIVILGHPPLWIN